VRNLLAAALPTSPAAARRLWPFAPPVTLVAILGAAVLVVTLGVWQADDRMRERRALQADCAAAARILVTHKPVLAKTVRLADACADLRRLQGTEP